MQCRKYSKMLSAGLALFIAIFFSQSTAFAGPFDTCEYTVKVKDGQYGFVWKPTGAHRPEAVLVLPSRFKGFLTGTTTTTVRTVTIYQNETLKKVGTMVPTFLRVSF